MLGTTWVELEALLKRASGKASDPNPKQLRYLLMDILPKLTGVYLKKICGALEIAVLGQNEQNIVYLANCLASELAARGWAVAGLHSWVRTFFLMPPKDGSSFIDRLRSFASRVQQSEQSYLATVCISGSSDLHKITELCGFTFSATPPQVAPGAGFEPQALAKFLRPNLQKTYAQTKLKAVDHASAAQVALEKFAKCQDRLRFNFSKEPILSDGSRILVAREADNKHRLVAVGARIPSLEHHLPLDAFLQANAKLDELFASSQLESSTQRRIEASVSHYRLGLDGRGYNDMFQSWWLGLETLTNIGEGGGGGIGAKVLKNAIPLLTHRYFVTQLIDISRAVYFICQEWPKEVIDLVGGSLNQQLKWWNTIRVLQDPSAYAAVSAILTKRPWIESRWKRASELVSNPFKLSSYLDDHRRLVSWQIQRLYRIRCCLVHGTPIATPLQIPTSHLEYYLREAIYVVLIAVGRSKQLKSIEAVIDRAEYCSERRRSILVAKGADLSSVKAALDADLTFKVFPQP